MRAVIANQIICDCKVRKSGEHCSLCLTKRKLRVKVILLWKIRSQCNFVYSALKNADRYIGVTFVAHRYRVTLTSRITYIYISVRRRPALYKTDYIIWFTRPTEFMRVDCSIRVDSV